MNYEQTKILAFKTYPMVYYDEIQFLNSCFFLGGTEYEWANGEIIDIYVKSKPDSIIKRTRKNKKKRLLKELEITHLKYFIKFQLKLLEQNYKKQQDYWKKDSLMYDKVFYIYESSNIFKIPDNVKPDWLDAAKKAIKIAKTGEMGKLKKEDKKLLKLAEEKVKKLSN
jgi:hypothetical protein